MSRLLEKGGKQFGRVGTRVATLGHVLQVPHKFHFDVVVSRLEMIPKGRTCVLVLERREKLESTNTFKGGPDRSAEVNEKLSLEVTLFRKEGNENFEMKNVKLAVRLGDKNGKTVSKIHIDISQYAKVPSGDVDIKLKMTGGAIVHGKFESRLIKSGRSSGPSTLFSAITTGSGGLGGSGCIDDLDDLDIGEEEDLKLNSTTTNRDSQSSSKVTPPYVPSPPPGNETLNEKETRLTRTNMKLEEALHRVEREGRRLKEDLAEANERLYAMNGRDDGDNSGVADAEKELSKLKSKIKAQEETNGHLLKAGKELKSSLETARRLHTELESRSKDADMRQESEAEKLRADNQKMETELEMVIAEIKREPIASDLSTDLRTSQLQLDLLNMETKKALNELEEVRR